MALRLPPGAWPAKFERLWHPRFHQGYFDNLYAGSRDPHGFDTEPFEREKYEDILGQLSGRRFSRALEVGCSIGTFTEILAPLCDELVAVDISGQAVRRARERMADHPGVLIERRTLPMDMPPGCFDLIVCSDVMAYWHREVLRGGLPRLVDALLPGGRLISLHWRGEYRRDLGADVHELLSERIASRTPWSSCARG